MTTIIKFKANYIGGFKEDYRCDSVGDYSGEYVPLAEYAALTAERDGLAMQVKDLEELRDHLSNALQDEAGIQKNQREANALKDLSRLVKAWRDEANGHYCQTYNTGQAKGLNVAANMLNEYVKELERRTERQDKPPTT